MIVWTAGNSAGATRSRSGSVVSRSAFAAPSSRSRCACSAGRRATLCRRRAPTSRSLASSSGPCPASSLTVTRVPPRRPRVAPGVHPEGPQAGLVRHHGADEAVDVVLGGCHADVLARTVGPDLLPDDVGRDRVVALAPHRGRDGDDLVDDGLAGVALVAHLRRDVVNAQPPGHRRTPIVAYPADRTHPTPAGGTGSRWPDHVQRIFTWRGGQGRHDRRRAAVRARARTLRAVRALRRFTVRAQLPAPLAPLQTLATNLRWSWHPPTQDLFAALDHEAWERGRHDPVRLLGEIPTARFAELAADAEVVVTVQELADDLDTLPGRAALVPDRARGRLDDARSRRLLLDGVRRHRGAAELLRRARRPGRRPPQGRVRPRRAADRRRSAVPLGLLPPVAVARRLAARALPVLDPQGLPLQLLTDARRDAGARPRRHAGRAHAAGPGLAAPRSAASRCCCSTPTSRRTTRSCAASRTGSTAVTRTTASTRRSSSASAACGPSGPSAPHRPPAAGGVPHQRGSRRLPRPRAHSRAA